MSNISFQEALILLRASFSAPRVLHLLRCSPSKDHPALELFDSQLKSAVCHITNSRLSDGQWLQAYLPVKEGGLGVRRVTSLALPAFLASAASTLSLQASILTGCSGSIPDCHFLQAYLHICWIGRPSLAHRLINFLPNRLSGIALSSHLTAPKFSPALIVLFNWLPFWLLSRVIVENGCLLCRLHPAASDLTTRQSGLQSVYVLSWTCVSPPLPMWLAGRRS